MGSTSRHFHNPGQVHVTKGDAIHQSPGSQSSQVLLFPIPALNQGQIHIYCSLWSLSCMFYINRQGGPRSPALCTKVVRLWNWCTRNEITITVTYLPGIQNVTTDTLSRHFFQDWVGNRLQHIAPRISSVGHPSNRLVLHKVKQEMRLLLLKGLIGSPINVKRGDAGEPGGQENGRLGLPEFTVWRL